jgi:hypothetical protein
MRGRVEEAINYTVIDGVRRGLLAGMATQSPLEKEVVRRSGSAVPNAVFIG